MSGFDQHFQSSFQLHSSIVSDSGFPCACIQTTEVCSYVIWAVSVFPIKWLFMTFVGRIHHLIFKIGGESVAVLPVFHVLE